MAVRGKEKDYVAIARKKVNRAQDAKWYPKFLVYGRNKKGKTTFALSAGVDKTLVLDPEQGTDTMRSLNPWRWPITRWQDIADAMGALRTGTLSPHLLTGEGPEEPFEYLAVDGLTRMNNYALKYIGRLEEQKDLDRRPGIIDRRDYNKSGELMKDFLAQCHALQMGVIYTAQERMKTFDSGDDDTENESVFFVPDLPDGVRGAANSLVDLIGRIYVTRVEVKNSDKTKPQRRLYIGVHDRYDTGFRSDFGDKLPEFVRYPTVPKLTKILSEGPPPPKKRTKKASS